MEGRNILDEPLIINEVCAWAKSIKKKILLFQVDFDKAFHYVNWEYLDSILLQIGLGNKWRSWIRGCLSSSCASIILNGSPTKEFNITKGVRQGDPVSPFLFKIIMEGLHVALKSIGEKGNFKGVQTPGNGPLISHLFFANVALFVSEWCKSNLKNLDRILKCFHIASGLKVNFFKSKVFGIMASKSKWVLFLSHTRGYRWCKHEAHKKLETNHQQISS